MSPTEQLLADLKQWPQQAGLWQPPRLQPCALLREAATLPEAQLVLQRLRQFMQAGEVVGWIETPDTSRLVRGDADIPEGVPVLNAELVAGSHSLHVRLLDGAWRVTDLRDGTAGEPLLKDAVELVCSDPQAGLWLYERYWAPQAHGGLQLVAARLSGLTGNPLRGPAA